jgi:hypothetical protein
MNKWDDILIQLDKERIKRTEDRWTTGQGVRLENEFPQSDHPQNQLPPQDTTTYTHANTFNTMKRQVRKKKVSKKSKEQRIADKSISLAERVSIPNA